MAITAKKLGQFVTLNESHTSLCHDTPSQIYCLCILWMELNIQFELCVSVARYSEEGGKSEC
jgi:hypothetical protein